MIAPWVYKPVAISVTATPTLHGGPSGSPVLHRKRNEMEMRRVKRQGGRQMAIVQSLRTYVHVHKSRLTLNDDVVSRVMTIRPRLSIP